MTSTKPGDSPIVCIGWYRYLRLFGYQHLERQAGERTRRDDEQAFILDQVIELTQEILMKLVGRLEIEGQTASVR